MDAKFWNGKRAPGVADTINPDAYNSILEVFEESAKKNADRPAFTGIGYTLTYADIDKYSTDLAVYLQTYTDLQPGDRIAIQMPNLLQFPIAVFGALKAGLVIVNTNPLYTVREMHHQFNDSGARALIFMDVFGHMVEEIVDDTPIEHLIVTSIADMLPNPKRTLINLAAKHIKKLVQPYDLPQAVRIRKALSLGEKGKYQRPESAKPEDIAVLQYTGGTTGVAKGAMLTHRNIIANMQQAKAHLSQLDKDGNRMHEPGSEIIVAPLPLYHIYAFTVHLMAMVDQGNHNILIANPRDTSMFIRFIKPWQFTAFIGLNTLFVSLMNHPDFKNCDFSKLKLTLSGGTALQGDTGDKWKEATGVSISEAYGLTECSPAVCINPVGDLTQPGSVGVPVPSTAVKCIDDEGNEVPIGERGELCVKGPQVMKGYWKRPEATDEIFDDERWLKTGDVAVIQEDGFVRIVDRIKDMVLVSGFNVYPNEIEDIVSQHDGVENCAVIGVPDEKTGEAVKLYIVPVDKSLTPEDVKQYCKMNLTAYKVPKQIEFREELPMTPVGKILRKDLRAEEIQKRQSV
ncbi:AMP-binding protein [Sansalvadorimonas sp. 2012CJ34-2]|uniref:Long-chain-fatty-acid--CoA ligase n=1 Tax=Parendozoicomonas callyspongiae TaxID=2942213 RepID=A0ABT0PCL7_9GAMM|nr:AMP-binding protein [Sansalvadorimonas sp. 2012CJ34-2]MCL6269001.1 AMP-binding protein [Sansalvadorimonas sp. 2012CJ34-2]